MSSENLNEKNILKQIRSQLQEAPFTGLFLLHNDIILFANIYVLNLIEYDKTEIIRKNIWKQIIHPDDLDLVTKKIEERFQGRSELDSYKIRIISKTGKIIPVHLTTRLIDFYDSKAILGSIIEENMNSETVFNFLEEQDLIGITIFQGDRLKYVNRQLCKLVGYSKEDLLSNGKKLKNIIVPIEYQGLEHSIAKTIFSGEREKVNGHFVLNTKSGHQIDINCFSKQIEFLGNSALLSIIVPISKRKLPDEFIVKLQPNHVLFLQYLQDNFNIDIERYINSIIKEEIDSRMEDLKFF